MALWNELDGQTKLITAANFCQNGKFAVVGSYDGRCVFYTTEQLKYYTQIHVRSTRGKNSKGRKISGIETLPNEDKVRIFKYFYKEFPASLVIEFFSFKIQTISLNSALSGRFFFVFPL